MEQFWEKKKQLNKQQTVTHPNTEFSTSLVIQPSFFIESKREKKKSTGATTLVMPLKTLGN